MKHIILNKKYNKYFLKLITMFREILFIKSIHFSFFQVKSLINKSKPKSIHISIHISSIIIDNIEFL